MGTSAVKHIPEDEWVTFEVNSTTSCFIGFYHLEILALDSLFNNLITP